MLSILIPVYNVDISKLLENLHSQISDLKYKIEIIVYDDHSKCFVQKNKSIASKYNLTYKYLDKNIGRSEIRNRLAEKANYQYLLFLDCDVIPESNSFLKNYIQHISIDTQVIYGGRKHLYSKSNQKKLRWKYGFYKEDKTAIKREKKPYLSIITNNLLVEKQLFNKIKFHEHLKTYGCEDLLFGQELKLLSARIQHIENPVIHDQIDSNKEFLVKTREAWKNLVYLEDQKLIPKDLRPIQRLYLKLDKLKIAKLCNWLYKNFNSTIIKILLHQNTSLVYFDLYRVLYFCHLKQVKK